MFKRKKKTGCQTPEFRKPTPPPPPTSGSNAVKPNPNYVPPASVNKPCTYETPCGWCTKWDKKCDKKIGCDATSVEPVRKMAQNNEGLSCYKCRHYDSISSVCSDCHPIFKNFEAKEN